MGFHFIFILFSLCLSFSHSEEISNSLMAPSTLISNSTVNSLLISSNKRFQAIINSEGNFCVYSSSVPLWCSDTIQDIKYGPFTMNFQDDGNICLSAGGCVGPSWISRPPYQLVMEDDGFLCINGDGGKIPRVWCNYRKFKFPSDVFLNGMNVTSLTSDGYNAMLSTIPMHFLTSLDGEAHAYFQNGNFVVNIQNGGPYTFETRTKTNRVAILTLQTDGNLCIYDSDVGMHWMWCSFPKVSGKGPYKLELHSSGMLYTLDSDGNITWHSNSILLS